jgi:acetaldehyde dehydrogenase
MQIGIAGSAAIGADFLAEMPRDPDVEPAGIASVDSGASGLEPARCLCVCTTGDGLAGLAGLGPRIGLMLDATAATAHRTHVKVLVEHGIRWPGLTLAAVGPAVVRVAENLSLEWTAT